MDKKTKKNLTVVGHSKLFDAKALREDFGITVQEIIFLRSLKFSPEGEWRPGTNNNNVYFEPVCLALYDFIFDALLLHERSKRSDRNVHPDVAMAVVILEKMCLSSVTSHCKIIKMADKAIPIVRKAKASDRLKAESIRKLLTRDRKIL